MKNYFTKVYRHFKKYALLSGLNVNDERPRQQNTFVVGSRKMLQVRFLRDMNFCWDPGIFTVLGIKFSTDIKQITSISCEGKLTEIKRILNTWSNARLLLWERLL